MAEKPKKDMSKKRISIIIVGMIVAAITMIVIGIWLADDAGVLPIDDTGYDYVIALFGFISLVFAAYALGSKYLTEGMFFIITALVAFVCLIMQYSTEDLANALFYMMVAYIVSAVIFHIRGERVFELGSLIAGISLAGAFVTNLDQPVFFFLFSAGGLLVLISGCFSLADIGPEWMRARNVTVHRVSTLNYATTVTYSAGTFLSCLVFFSIEMERGSVGMLTFKVVVALLTMLVGFYGLCNGCHRRGSDLILLSTYSIISGVSDIADLGMIPYLNIVLAIPLITSAIQEYQEGAPIKTVCSLLSVAVMITDVFFTSTPVFGAVVMAAKLISLYDCVTTWFIFETGWAPRFMRYNKGSVKFDE